MQVIKNSNFVQNICTSQDAKVVGKNFWSNFYWWAFQSNQKIQIFFKFICTSQVAKIVVKNFCSNRCTIQVFKDGSVKVCFKTICTSQFEKFDQELLFKLLVINIQELQMSPIIQFCSNNWWCKRQVAMIILNKNLGPVLVEMSSRSLKNWRICLIPKRMLSSRGRLKKMNSIAFAQIFAEIR